jgi:hypothetical protein
MAAATARETFDACIFPFTLVDLRLKISTGRNLRDDTELHRPKGQLVSAGSAPGRARGSRSRRRRGKLHVLEYVPWTMA